MDEIIEKAPLTSLNIAEEQTAKLRSLFPEVFTEGGKIDFDKLKLTLGEAVDTGKERYGMNWPGKADCYKTIQQPSIATLVPDREGSVDFDTSENLFIEGDNLEVLKLLQKSYLGKVKMIYIDPPYNTGNDFIYPDNYSENLQTYLEYTGQIDSGGRKFSTNTETDGRFHSKWMNMMYPRLFLAKNLLRENGVIFISIDDNEVNNLKAMCNEIFGEENFVVQISVENNPKGRVLDKYFATSHEYVVCYSKNMLPKGSFSILKDEDQVDKDYPLEDVDGQYRELELRNTHREFGKHNRKNLYYPIYFNPKLSVVELENSAEGLVEIFPVWEDGFEGCWTWGRDKAIEEKHLLVVRVVRGVYKVYRKAYSSDATRKVKSLLTDKSFHTEKGQTSFNSLFESKEKIFQSPKSVYFIKELLKTSTSHNDILLDFFAGSATAAQAILELNEDDGGNRKFICIQIPEPTDEKSEAAKAGYKNIAEISRERIQRVIQKINQEPRKEELFKTEKPQQALGFKSFRLAQSNFKLWNASVETTPETIQAQLYSHIDHISPEAEQEAILYELLIKSGFTLTTPIQKMELESKTVFSIADGAMLICLEKNLTTELIKAIGEQSPQRVICLDEGFGNNDQLKTNAVQIMKSKKVLKFQTV